MPGPLTGIRVLDLSRVLAGPWASQTLGDLGAEIIKIERPGLGDDTRSWGPPFTEPVEGARGESAYFIAANRGKASVTIDFSKPEGQALIRRLAADADILIENFKVGGLAKLGLGPADLCALNPRLIYASITGFGQTGPYAQRPGYDFIMQGMGGLMSLTGAPDGEPMRVGVAVTDLFTGLYTSTAILAALQERHTSGRGQHVDVALFDVQVATLANQMNSYLITGQQPLRLGNAHPSIVPYQVFATADGHINLAVGNDGQFARFCGVAGRAELGADPAYTTNPARVANRAVLVPLLQEIIGARTTGDWVSACEAAAVPCGPINQLADLMEDPQLQARGLITTATHETAGPVRMVASPMRFSRSEAGPPRAPPVLGADTDRVLTERLGATAAELAAWRQAGII
jgi:crotonobetainyl-CoA:carnitine CoA-transferase CaiB-like acyl-CoA transferase